MEVLRHVTIKAIHNKINMKVIWKSLKEEGNMLASTVNDTAVVYWLWR